jgi:ribosomal-protein-serine acetyltransferase
MTLTVDSNLALRPLELSDALDIFNTIDRQREYLGKWLPFVAFTQERKDTESFVKSVVNAPEDTFEYTFTIRVYHEFVGIIALKNSDKTNRITEIGYWLSEKFQKKGIVTKSVERLCDFAFKEQGFNRVQIKCAVANIPSINIPKKLGFKFEGIERDGELLSENTFTDLEVYSKLKND